MKNELIFIIILFHSFAFQTYSQEKYITKTGRIYFISHTEAIDIDATNNSVACVLNAENGEMIVGLLMKSFEFKLEFAGEHFNENYVESDKFPRSTFKGKIKNYDKSILNQNGVQNIEVEGELTIHGKTRKIIQSGTIEKSERKLLAKSKMKINLSDYDIAVPELVKERVSQIIDIEINFILEAK